MFNLGFNKLQKAPTDTVVSLHFFDTLLWRAFVLYYTMFFFDDVLDPEPLHNSLETLTRQEELG